MVLITLIGDSHARVGNRFYYMGPTEECKDCRLRNVCFNLDIGSLYEITQLRDTKHPCTLREGEVRVVQVDKVPFKAAIPKKLAIDGSVITFEPRTCNNIGCENRAFCCPVNLNSGDKHAIDEIIGDVRCPEGEALTLVKLE